jgi:hypothetical protein
VHAKHGFTVDNLNLEQNVQASLPEPSAIEARNSLEGVYFVSGCDHSQDYTNQFELDLLNLQDSAFEFTKIVANVKDELAEAPPPKQRNSFIPLKMSLY